MDKSLFEGLSVTLSNDDIDVLKERINNEKKEWQKAAQNDENFISDLRKNSEGKIYSTVERWLKKTTGLKFEDIDADLKGGERFREMLEKAISEIKATKDATNDDLQNQLLSAKNEIRELLDETIPAVEQKYKLKFDEKQIETRLAEKLSSLNIVPERVNPARTYAKAVLKDRFKLSWSHDDQIDIKTKQDLTPVINDKTASFEDVLKSVLDEGGFLIKSNGASPENVRNISPQKGSAIKTEWSENAQKFAAANGITL